LGGVLHDATTHAEVPRSAIRRHDPAHGEDRGSLSEEKPV
jgi:hypothetical protein